MITLDKIIIDDEFRDLLSPLEPEQFAGLAGSVKTDGWLDPLIVWQHHNILIDGHNRFAIWQAEGGEGPDIVEKRFASREEAADWIIDHQLNRRNETPERRAYLIGKKYANRKQAGSGAPKGNKNAGKNNSVKVTELNRETAKSIAKEQGVSPSKVEKDARFAEAVDKLDAQGVLPKAAALSGKAKSGIARKTVIEAAKQETPEAAKAVLERPTTRDMGKAVAASRKERKDATAVTANRHPIDKAINKSLGELVRGFADRNKKFPSDAHDDIGDLLDRVIALWKIWKGEAA